MRIAYWDTSDPEMHFDNPNLRWGSPSYLLEPGDPGYVPPLIPVSEPTTNKKKRMKRQNYYPVRVTDQVAWLLNYADKLPGRATALGLAPATVTAIVADCLWLAYVLQNWLDSVRAFGLSCTQTSIAAQTGAGSTPLALNTFTAPALPTGVTPQNAGSLIRIFTSVQDIKNGHKCTDAIAAELGIVGSAANGPDLTTVQPIISAKISGSEVAIKWGWQGNSAFLDACELLVDRNDGKGYVPLTIDTTPNYNDTAPFPAAKTVWSYKAIYRLEDKQVGLWSQIVTVAVGG
jgi:hypothetical protein